jgi:cytoskeletal protein RodZ
VVYGGGLENRLSASSRGFESHHFRHRYMPENKLKTFWLKNKSASIAILVAVLALLIVGGLVIFNIFKPKEAEKTSSNSSQSQKDSPEAPIPQNLSTPENKTDPIKPTPPPTSNLRVQ